MNAMLATIEEEGVRTDGDCFPVAANALLTAPAGSVLVHGEVQHSLFPALRYAHAWVEVPMDIDGCEFWVVLDNSNGEERSVAQALYYLIGRVVDHPGKLQRYSLPEATRKMCEHKHFGPWDLDVEL